MAASPPSQNQSPYQPYTPIPKPAPPYTPLPPQYTPLPKPSPQPTAQVGPAPYSGVTVQPQPTPKQIQAVANASNASSLNAPQIPFQPPNLAAIKQQPNVQGITQTNLQIQAAKQQSENNMVIRAISPNSPKPLMVYTPSKEAATVTLATQVLPGQPGSLNYIVRQGVVVGTTAGVVAGRTIAGTASALATNPVKAVKESVTGLPAFANLIGESTVQGFQKADYPQAAFGLGLILGTEGFARSVKAASRILMLPKISPIYELTEVKESSALAKPVFLNDKPTYKGTFSQTAGVSGLKEVLKNSETNKAIQYDKTLVGVRLTAPDFVQAIRNKLSPELQVFQTGYGQQTIAPTKSVPLALDIRKASVTTLGGNKLFEGIIAERYGKPIKVLYEFQPPKVTKAVLTEKGLVQMQVTGSRPTLKIIRGGTGLFDRGRVVVEKGKPEPSMMGTGGGSGGGMVVEPKGGGGSLTQTRLKQVEQLGNAFGLKALIGPAAANKLARKSITAYDTGQNEVISKQASAWFDIGTKTSNTSQTNYSNQTLNNYRQAYQNQFANKIGFNSKSTSGSFTNAASGLSTLSAATSASAIQNASATRNANATALTRLTGTRTRTRTTIQLQTPLTVYSIKTKKTEEDNNIGKKRKVKGFITEVRRFGQFISISGKPTPREEALRLGVESTKRTLAATFRIREVARQVEEQASNRLQAERAKRLLQTEFTKLKSNAPNTFVQKRETRLGTRSEVSAINRAKDYKKKLFG